MDPERWQQIEKLFHRCGTLTPGERKDFFDRQGIPQDLREEVESLLRADPGTAGSLTADIDRALDVELEEDPGIIAGYRVLRLLGRGGQGSVFLAERLDEGLEGTVAIKVLRRGLDTADVLARFRLEQRLLSGFDHPAVARFFDAGTTDDGRPYFVMEAVDGRPIDRFCREEGLDLRARLELFCRAAEAVQAAHRRLIIHRDLKPSNLLVTADGTPKLLDFGIAKSLDPEKDPATTVAGERPLTPSVASPEQVRGEVLTTATDVYSLGALLYRLLTGRDPLPLLPGDSVERVICEREPEPPSVFGGRALRGDLDAVVLQALHKEPERRYGSVENLVADVRSHLDGLPVQARRAGFLYRAGKFVRRHGRALGTTAAVLGIVLALSFHFNREVRRERDRAVVVTEFLERLFRSGDANDPRTLGEVLGEGARELPTLEPRPRIYGELAAILGVGYQSQGDHERGEALLRTSLEARRSLRPVPREEVAESHYLLGRLLLERGHREEAEEHLREALLLRRSLHGERHPEVTETRVALVEAAWWRGEDEAAYREARNLVEDLWRALPPGPLARQRAVDHARALDLYAGLLHGRGALDAADAAWLRALEALERGGVEQHLVAADVWSNRSFNFRARGDLEAAESAILEASRIDRELLGEKSLRLGIDLLNHGVVLRRLGRPAEAVDACGRALHMTLEAGGPSHYNLPGIHLCLGRAHEARGDAVAAEGSYREALRLRRASVELGADPRGTITGSLRRLAGLLASVERHDEALPLWQEYVEILGVEAPGSVGACGLARSLVALGRGDEAKPWSAGCEQ